MLREVAEGGAHLDRETLTALAAVPRTVGGDRRRRASRAGDFRPVHPVFAYFSMLAPIVFYLAGAPIRNELSAPARHRHARDVAGRVRRAGAGVDAPRADA